MRQLVEEILEDLSSGEVFHFRVMSFQFRFQVSEQQKM